MQRALFLAAKGNGRVSPNPCVGCVIVNKNRIVGEGYHQRFGGPHAEPLAFRKAGAKARGGTAYITLEPCTHWGKTPPCLPLVIASGVRNVVVAMKDPNPRVAGKGISGLRKAGIRVQFGIGEEASRFLNRAYITWMTKKRPYTILKMAMTLDGKTATAKGESRWITSAASRALVHRLRAESDAVLVGANTAILDNPQLTSHGAGRNPMRIVLDPQLRSSSRLQIYRDGKAPTLLVTSAKTPEAKLLKFRNQSIQILKESLKVGSFELRKVLRDISKMRVSKLFIEGGQETAWRFLRQGLIDEIYLFVAPLLLGGQASKGVLGGEGWPGIAQARRVSNLSISRIGPDILIHGFLNI